MESANFWELLKGTIALNPQAFTAMKQLPNANTVAITVLLLAGFSQAIGQSFILFMNRVKPLRFLISLGLSTLLFVISYCFWIWSTWLVSRSLFQSSVDYQTVYQILGLATAPQLFNFLVMMPYFGVVIQLSLSLWTLLAFVQGLSVATTIEVWPAFAGSLLGWVVLQVLQRTIGRPLAILGSWLSNTTAGTNLVTDLRDLETLLASAWQSHVIHQENPAARKTNIDD